MYTSLKSKPIRVCLAVLMALSLFFLFTPCALAAPTDTPDASSEPPGADTFLDDPEGAYVELVAEVPEGFRGSVSVMLKNEESGEMYTITSFRVNFYSNSLMLPYGEYSIEDVFTSEDSMIYEAFIEEDCIKLDSNYTLHAKVLHNETGAAYVNGDSDIDQEPMDDMNSEENTSGNEITTDTPSQPLDTGAAKPDDTPDADETVTPDDNDKEDELQNAPADDQPESKGSVVLYILKVFIGTAVFVGIVFGTVYIVRKNQGL